MAYQSMDEEVERYKKLLGDWKQASQASGPTREPDGLERHDLTGSAPRPEPRPAPRAAANGDDGSSRARMGSPAPAAPEGQFNSGSILCLNDEELVIYRRPVAGKPLDMVYSLLADGAVKIDGLDFNNYRIEEIGQLPPAKLKTLQADMRWTRKMIAPHCFVPEDAERIPDPDEAWSRGQTRQPSVETMGDTDVPRDTFNKAVQQESAVRAPDEEAEDRDNGQTKPHGKLKIRRGQTIQIKMGYNNWEAVYWGRDAKGSVVAHNTHNHWQLMHFDLGRYKDSMTVSPEPDPRLVEEIGRDLSTQQKDAVR